MALEPRICKLFELEIGQQGDFFALLVSKDRATTRDGKPYYRVSFRDAGRSVAVMVWNDTPWFVPCDTQWKTGQFYKLRGLLQENQYGLQLDLDRVREIQETDHAQGFDPADFCDRSRFNVDEMFVELLGLAENHISDLPLRTLVTGLLQKHADQVKTMAAAARNHHAYYGGFVEHVLSVTRSCVYLADKYLDYYPATYPPLSKSLVVAGAILHDIGKVAELKSDPTGTEYTPRGRLIGHILLGRDMVREQAVLVPDLNPEVLLRLEHIVVSHQGVPEWGSPVTPHTLEALIVHYADDLDAKYHMMARALEEVPADGEMFTSKSNPLRRGLFRQLGTE
jgi:3'-5' exoribonuclease